jgi:hypothetical protein
MQAPPFEFIHLITGSSLEVGHCAACKMPLDQGDRLVILVTARDSRPPDGDVIHLSLAHHACPSTDSAERD